MEDKCKCCGRKREIVGGFRLGDFGIRESKLIKRCEYCHEEGCDCKGWPIEIIEDEVYEPSEQERKEATTKPVYDD